MLVALRFFQQCLRDPLPAELVDLGASRSYEPFGHPEFSGLVLRKYKRRPSRPFDQQRRVFGGTSVPGVQTVRFAAVATGEDYTRLTITLSDHELQQELEHWIMEELGGTSPQAQDELHASWWRRIFGS